MCVVHEQQLILKFYKQNIVVRVFFFSSNDIFFNIQ